MTNTNGITRKLTTILAADAANYSGRMAEDEVGTVQALRKSRMVFETRITSRGGRIANTAGDGLIADFPSVIEAVSAAIAIQRELLQHSDLLPFRIGLHLGDVIVEGEDLLGDGVNLAARLQEYAPVGGIFASAQVVDHADGRLQAEFRPLGPAPLKNLGNNTEVFAVIADGIKAPLDLQSLAPRVSYANAPAPSHTIEVAPVASTVPTPHDKFKKTLKRSGWMTLGLLAVDVSNGLGPSWPLLIVVGIGINLIIKWRKLPKKHE
ncbi:MAG: adenylate/guanylate cyclase domain-containing protein [Aliishimia sp.]